jgi:hypothetical protein
MMNESRRTFFTLFTSPISFSERFFSCFIPSETVTLRRSTFPSRVISSTLKFGLPFCFTTEATKSLFAVKVTSRACDIFAAPTTFPCYKIATTRVRFTSLRQCVAYVRTKLVFTITSCAYILATLTALISRCYAPTVFQVTTHRAKLSLFIAIVRVKFSTALKAVSDYCICRPIYTTHTTIIPQINRTYLDIAIERLRQDVLF